MSHFEANALTEEVIAEYLRDHPDFFLRRRDLVDGLALSHQEQGTVSLVHVQLNRQRQRIEELEEEITSLMSLARSNDQTFHEFMALQDTILQCHSLFSVVKAIEEMAKSMDLVAYVRLLECDSGYYSLSNDAYQRFATNHLNGKEAYLGRMRQAERERLFGNNHCSPEMGSYAVLPLKRKSLQGVLAFSSADSGHFQPHMDTLFLRHLAMVMSHLIEYLPWQSEQDERISHTST